MRCAGNGAAGGRLPGQGPLSAAEAASVILNGIRDGDWRILVGEDATMIDTAVRAKPQAAYDYAELFSAQQAGRADENARPTAAGRTRRGGASPGRTRVVSLSPGTARLPPRHRSDHLAGLRPAQREAGLAAISHAQRNHRIRGQLSCYPDASHGGNPANRDVMWQKLPEPHHRVAERHAGAWGSLHRRRRSGCRGAPRAASGPVGGRWHPGTGHSAFSRAVSAAGVSTFALRWTQARI